MPIINIKSDGIAIGQNSTISNSLQINEEWIVSGLYPIGSIHITTDSTNPSAYFGGTWERFGNGRVLVCVDEENENLASSQLEGGASEVTLTTNNLPNHRHRQDQQTKSVKKTGGADRPYDYRASDSDHKNSSYTGGSQAHNNLQPYITCYMWVRTA